MTHPRSTARLVWLGALLAALIVVLLAPALARADEGSAGDTAVAEQPATGTDATAAGAAAADAPATTEEPAPADEPVAAEPPAASEEQAGEPAAPPSGGTASDEAAGEPSAPPSSGEVDLPSIALPPVAELVPAEIVTPVGEALATIPPTLAELAPLLTTPEAPRAPVVADPLTEAPQAPPGPAGAATTRAAQSLTVGSAVLGGPPMLADPVSPAALAAAAAADAALAVGGAPLQGGLISLDPARRVERSGAAAAAAVAAAAVPAAFAAAATAEIQAPQLVSPSGPAPAQSLLAVLASYILPGSGPVPAGTLFVLLMLGVLLWAAYGPRPAGSERIWLSGLLGPRAGHGVAVRRPG